MHKKERHVNSNLFMCFRFCFRICRKPDELLISCNLFRYQRSTICQCVLNMRRSFRIDAQLLRDGWTHESLWMLVYCSRIHCTTCRFVEPNQAYYNEMQQVMSKFLVMCMFTWTSVISSHLFSPLLLPCFSLQKPEPPLCTLWQEICLFHHEYKQILCDSYRAFTWWCCLISVWFKMESLMRLHTPNISFVIIHNGTHRENGLIVEFKMWSISTDTKLTHSSDSRTIIFFSPSTPFQPSLINDQVTKCLIKPYLIILFTIISLFPHYSMCE